MSADLVSFASIGWDSLPLCRRYGAVSLSGFQPLGENCQAWSCLWAVALGEGAEIPVCLVESAPLRTPVRSAISDLTVRGVEAVDVFVCDDPALVGAEVCRAYPEAIVLPSIAGAVRVALERVAPRDRADVGLELRSIYARRTLECARVALEEFAAGALGARYPAVISGWRTTLEQLAPMYRLGPRLRRLVLLADDSAERLNQRLARSVARHGGFANREAAASFIADALRRAEHLLDAPAKTRVARPAASLPRPDRRIRAPAC